jgi:hypothetical protein
VVPQGLISFSEISMNYCVLLLWESKELNESGFANPKRNMKLTGRVSLRRV